MRNIERKFLSVSFMLLALQLTNPSAASASVLFSVDGATNELVTIDSSTGHVVVIGGLGRGVADIDLAVLGGRLYGVNSFFSVRRAELLDINPATGAATYLGDLVRGTDVVTSAEGLGSKGGKLYVGFTTTPADPVSHLLGELSLTGTIANDVDAATDIDGMGADSSGKLYSIDANPGPGTNTLFSLQPTSTVGSYSTTGVGGVDDIVFADKSLYGITDAFAKLHIIDAGNGSLLGTVDLDRTGSYLGLADSAAIVPEPGTLVVWLGLSLIGCTMTAVRRTVSNG